MAILNDLKDGLVGSRDPFPPRPMFQVTQMGRQKAHAFEAGGPELKVLTALDEGGPSDIDEIKRRANFEQEKCELIIRKLMGQRLVQKV